MSYSYSVSDSVTFTVTHARHIAAKVTTDLKRMQRFYGQPSDTTIEDYEAELIVWLKTGYLREVAYGFKRDGQWIEPMLKYTAKELAGASGTDDDPGRVRPGANISGATFYSYLTRTSAWFALTQAQRDEIEREMPFQRGTASEPAVNGYFTDDRSYSAGGRALQRASLRSFA
jgi:hypothetical protein